MPDLGRVRDGDAKVRMADIYVPCEGKAESTN